VVYVKIKHLFHINHLYLVIGKERLRS